MIDSKRFDKWNIIEWEDRTKATKTWSNETPYFQKLVASKERYASVVGGTAKKGCFKSAVRTDEHNKNKIRSLGSVLPFDNVPLVKPLAVDHLFSVKF